MGSLRKEKPSPSQEQHWLNCSPSAWMPNLHQPPLLVSLVQWSGWMWSWQGQSCASQVRSLAGALPLAAAPANPARASLHAVLGCIHLGSTLGAAMTPTLCESPAGKVACHRILQSASGSGFHLTVIRRYNAISINGRASDTLEKEAPMVFQSNKGNKYRKDYIKWTNVWNNIIARCNFHSYTVVIE